MANIRPPYRMPPGLVTRTTSRDTPLHNGMPCSANPVREMEQACQHLAARRRVHCPGTSTMYNTDMGASTWTIHGFAFLEPYTYRGTIWAVLKAVATGGGCLMTVHVATTTDSTGITYPTAPLSLSLQPGSKTLVTIEIDIGPGIASTAPQLEIWYMTITGDDAFQLCYPVAWGLMPYPLNEITL